MSFPDSLDALIRDGTVVWGFLSAVVIVLVATPLVERLATRIGALDEPTDRPRVHQRPVPRIGGLAILAGICIPAFVSVAGDGPYTGILIGTLAIGIYPRPWIDMGQKAAASLHHAPISVRGQMAQTTEPSAGHRTTSGSLTASN